MLVGPKLLIVTVLYLFGFIYLPRRASPGKDEVFLVVVLFAAPVFSLVATRKSGAAAI